MASFIAKFKVIEKLILFIIRELKRKNSPIKIIPDRYISEVRSYYTLGYGESRIAEVIKKLLEKVKDSEIICDAYLQGYIKDVELVRVTAGVLHEMNEKSDKAFIVYGRAYGLTGSQAVFKVFYRLLLEVRQFIDDQARRHNREYLPFHQLRTKGITN